MMSPFDSSRQLRRKTTVLKGLQTFHNPDFKTITSASTVYSENKAVLYADYVFSWRLVSCVRNLGQGAN